MGDLLPSQSNIKQILLTLLALPIWVLAPIGLKDLPLTTAHGLNMCYSETILSGHDLPEKDVSLPESTITEEEGTSTSTRADGVFCSCVNTVRQLGVAIPGGTDADEFVPNSPPFAGAVVILKYSTGVSHVAYLDWFDHEGFYMKQGNKEPCEYSEEFVYWDDPAIVGFWTP